MCRYPAASLLMYEDNWDDLTLAYAMTIHRAQGSQWPIVIAPIMSCNRTMLNQQILYLYTRAQDSRPCCMEHRALSICYRQYSFGQAEHLASGAAPQGLNEKLTHLRWIYSGRWGFALAVLGLVVRVFSNGKEAEILSPARGCNTGRPPFREPMSGP